MYLYSRLPIVSLLLSTTSAQYVLEDDYSVSSFASLFEFFTGDDPTHGYVNYLSQDASEAAGLYKADGASVKLGVDSNNVATGRGRDSVRVESLKRYNSGLFILDASHMPEGCGTWPAFWLYGPNWPSGGEVDIVEGVNSQATTSFATHTGPGCSISSSGFTAALSTSNCDINAPGQGTNVGCAMASSDTRTYGAGFNANGGGVFATEWTGEAIKIWFFPRGSIPSDVSSGTPSPSAWGLPQAKFSAPCEIDQHFSDQRIVLNTALCGDWAGAVWGADSTCSSKASTCQEFVQNNPTAFDNAYWSITSLKVYQQGGPAASPSTPVSSATFVPTTLSTQTVTFDTATPAFPPPLIQTTILPSPTSTSLVPPPFTSTTGLATTAQTTSSTTPVTSSFSTPFEPGVPSTFTTSTLSAPGESSDLLEAPPTPVSAHPTEVSTLPGAWAPTGIPSGPRVQSWGDYSGGEGGGGGRWGLRNGGHWPRANSGGLFGLDFEKR
ncbi:uncharacterized protein HMPREF1541_01388 [Cyphellophora europaea CBS 101466]|uniref:endo-1,3(4)-beta-glucanase n=1 Tax=Cyphellophora europaea (strain CBS 101466) TaxID=1220924 RepID=W2SES4_CYPE1|nr:uncharacterized protein HMPREF1541_01388 [Cyphellophora europaea CBS 101466]ETN47197.1 hypothetical protein HMPREF1541_01388 [Cyphellophora europaea CBS 101466]